MNDPKSTPEKLAYTVGEGRLMRSASVAPKYELIKTGELETVKVAGRRLIPRRSALRLLDVGAQ